VGSDTLARDRLDRRGRYPEGCIQARRSGSRPHPERSRTIFIAAALRGILIAQSPFPLLARRMLLPVGSTYPTNSDPLDIRGLCLKECIPARQCSIYALANDDPTVNALPLAAVSDPRRVGDLMPSLQIGSSGPVLPPMLQQREHIMTPAEIEGRRVVARRLFYALRAHYPDKYVALSIQPRDVADDEPDDLTVPKTAGYSTPTGRRSPTSISRLGARPSLGGAPDLLTRDSPAHRRQHRRAAGVAEAVTTPGLGATGGLRARGATPEVADTSK
jgi:hypothetical protein